ncbi:MAG TPA: VCBS repeat-containing protein [Planctomycetota bacterium]|nr:VCBS repeat-containing protein [Planctomycetota bacterium]
MQFDVHPLGLVASLPRDGLRTFDGPVVELGSGFAEWYGLEYRQGGRAYPGVAEGVAPDWTSREAIVPLRSESGLDWTHATARLHDALITTRFSFDSNGPYVIVEVRIDNLGRSAMRDVVYTREWRTASTGGWTFPPDSGAVDALPKDVARVRWKLGDLQPDASGRVTFSFLTSRQKPAPLQPLDVPLSLWTSPAFPSGVTYGAVLGISWGDYDGDDYPDVFCTWSKRLWRNLGGQGWSLVATLDALLPNTQLRYGCSFGDWDANGVQDLATAPRFGTDSKLHLLHNDGNLQFHDIAGNPLLVDVQPFGDAETLCWGDVDGDARLDLFVPVYPSWMGGPGNFFLHNIGAGPSGDFAFRERSATAGLDNPPQASRPEGAQFADLDGDGDLDLFSNGTLYRNRSQPGVPSFAALADASSGIGFTSVLDEGAQIFDFDLDGDLDLAVAYTSFPGVCIWEARGDGTFFALEPGVIQSPFIGLGLGLSAEDWDNDGDIDFSTRQVFRRNMLVETGVRSFVVATHSIPANHINSATPAWADWDKDGDLDCALGNWFEQGRFYANSTYDALTPAENRRYLRVRPVKESQAVSRGLDVEYGASVELRVKNVPDPWRRKKFTSSSAGYLNQNEYALHFGLPPDPTPGNPASDLELGVLVDFPVVSESAPWRVDEHVNPLLGNVALAKLVSREIKVFRVGEVAFDGVGAGPVANVSPQLVASAGGLVHSAVTTAIPPLVPSPNANTWTTLEVRTPAQGADVLVDEIVIDGQLALPFACSAGSFNLVLWDFSVPSHPVRVATKTASTSPRNSRTSVPWDLRLAPGRTYRIAAHLASWRATDVVLPVDHGNLKAIGAARYTDPEPCNATALSGVGLDAAHVYFALLFHG